MAAAGLGILVLVVAVLVAVWPARLTGFSASPGAASPSTTPAPTDVPGPVVLVPGFGGGTGGVDVLAARLRAAGKRTTVMKLPGDGRGDFFEQAATLDGIVTDLLGAGAPSVDVIGFSNGGVVARLWAQRYDGAHRARRIITLGSPHHGADLAAEGVAAVPGACPAACQQMVPGSSFIKGLTTPVPQPPAWLALWTTQDETVKPPESARLEGAISPSLQSICPALRVTHGGLPRDPVVARIVVAALGPAPMTAPTARVCTA
jgi:triacylglycerol lipase